MSSLASRPLLTGRNPYKVGDVVTLINSGVGFPYLSHGQDYDITDIDGDDITIEDDDGDESEYHFRHFELSPVPSQIAGAKATLLIIDDLVEQSYEEKKASRPVTSKGVFDKGDVVVYRDGTPTLTSLTVTWCTATAVVFDETYSMPFNPNEFEKEY